MCWIMKKNWVKCSYSSLDNKCSYNLIPLEKFLSVIKFPRWKSSHPSENFPHFFHFFHFSSRERICIKLIKMLSRRSGKLISYECYYETMFHFCETFSSVRASRRVIKKIISFSFFLHEIAPWNMISNFSRHRRKIIETTTDAWRIIKNTLPTPALVSFFLWLSRCVLASSSCWNSNWEFLSLVTIYSTFHLLRSELA